MKCKSRRRNNLDIQRFSTNTMPRKSKGPVGNPRMNIGPRDGEINDANVIIDDITETSESHTNNSEIEAGMEDSEMFDFDLNSDEEQEEKGGPANNSSRFNNSRRFRRTSLTLSKATSPSSKAANKSTSMWTSRGEASVDQSVNLMRPASPTANATGTQRLGLIRGIVGQSFRQQLFDIALGEDSAQPHTTFNSHCTEMFLRDKKVRARNWRACLVVATTLAVAVVVAAIMVAPRAGEMISGLNLGSNNSDKHESQQQQPQEEEMAAIPKTNRLEALMFLVANQGITEQAQLDIFESPANLALQWIAEEDPAEFEIPGYEQVARDVSNDTAEHELLQRYALAVFAFSVQEGDRGGTDSNKGDENAGRSLYRRKETSNREKFEQDWLSDKHICQWPGCSATIVLNPSLRSDCPAVSFGGPSPGNSLPLFLFYSD